ncbi:MAG: hypothetical protein AAGE61_19025 [Pseudomonadota bacterium]
MADQDDHGSDPVPHAAGDMIVTSAVREPFFYRLSGAAFLILCYATAHVGLRLLTSHNLGENDPLSLLQTQSTAHLAVSEGPLFDMLVLTVSQLIGFDTAVFQFVRYGLLAVALLFVFLAARFIMKSGFWALMTVESYALIYQISWRFHEGYTYPMIAMVAAAATFYAVNQNNEEDGAWVYAKNFILFLAVLTGATAGLWYAAFLLALLVGVLATRGVRNRLIVVLVFLAGLFLTVQLMMQNGGFSGSLPDDHGPLFGASQAALKSLAYLSPFIVIAGLIFAPVLRREPDSEPGMGVRLIRNTFTAGVVGLLIAGTVQGDAPYPEHALMPLFFLAPIYVIDYVRRRAPSAFLKRSYISVCLVLMGVALIVRGANLIVLDPVCKKCYFGIPFADLADALEERYGAVPRPLIVTSPDPKLSGHLLLFWTDRKNVLFNAPQIRPQPRVTDTRRLFVWPAEFSESDAVFYLRREGFDREAALRVISDADVFEVEWRHLYRDDGYRTSAWRASLVAP